MNSHRPVWLPYATLTLAGAVLLALAHALVVVTDALPWLRGPRPWPPEWQWPYRPLGLVHPDRMAIHMLLMLGYLIAAIWLLRPSARRRPGMTVGLAMVFLLLWQLAQTWVREENLLDTMIFRTYAPPLNGYFVATAQVDSVSETLHHYLATMPTFYSDKPQTHPPGLFLFYALFNGLCERLAGFSDWLAPLARSWAIAGRDWPLLADHLITSAFLTSWLQVLLVSLLPLSLYGMLRECAQGSKAVSDAQDEAREVALWSAVAMPLIPSLTLFFLQWDTNFPALGFGAWYFALRGQNRLRWPQGGMGRWLDWLWAGLLLSVLSWLSFGMLAFAGLIVLHLAWRMIGRQDKHDAEQKEDLDKKGGADQPTIIPKGHPWGTTNFLIGLGVMIVGWALLWLLARLVWGMDFFALLRLGLGNHYTLVTAQRQYRLWWWMNLVDFLLWLGPTPLLFGGIASLHLWRQAALHWKEQSHKGSRWSAWDDSLAGLATTFWVVLLALNFSGATRGEVGRLWLFLMPFPVVLTMAWPWHHRGRAVLLGLMAVQCWAVGYALAGVMA